MKRVQLDPIGDWPERWLAVVVAAQTGVVYEAEAGGVACVHVELEGYLVPIGSFGCDGQTEVDRFELTYLFHAENESGGCPYFGLGGRPLPRRLLEKLRAVVSNIPLRLPDTSVGPLALDEDLALEAAEAWVPVRMPNGERGFLTWRNCD